MLSAILAEAYCFNLVLKNLEYFEKFSAYLILKKEWEKHQEGDRKKGVRGIGGQSDRKSEIEIDRQRERDKSKD